MSSLKNIAVVVALMAIFTALFFGISAYIAKDTPIQSPSNETLQETDQKLVQNLSVEGQSEYVLKINEMLLDTTLTTDARNTLLYRKASALSIVRGSEDLIKANRAESIEILKTLIALPKDSQVSISLANQALLSLVRLQIQCCDSYRPIALDFPELYSKYSAKGYESEISRLLTISDLGAQMAVTYQVDRAYQAEVAYINAQIIRRFGNILVLEDRETILSRINSSLVMLDSDRVRDIFYSDVNNTTLLPAIYYAYAFDVYNTTLADKSDTVALSSLNAKIDALYEAGDVTLEDSRKVLADGVSIEIKKIYNWSRYLESMEVRYGADVVESEKYTTNLKKLLSLSSINQEVTALTDGRYRAALTGEFSTLSYIVSLRGRVPAIDAYLKSHGIN